MKRTAILIGALMSLAYLALAGLPVFGIENGPVSVTVDVALPEPCIELSKTTVDYGTLQLREGAGSMGLDIGSDGPINISNCSDRPVDVVVTGASATGSGATWALANPSACTGTSPLNQYSHSVSKTSALDPATSLTSSAQAFATGMAVDGSQNAYLLFRMPCKGSSGEGQTMSTSVTFTAVFPG